MAGHMTSNNGRKVSSLDALQAVLLITKHLDDLLPFLMALRQIPAEIPQRVGLIQQTARMIGTDADLARDWYVALQLLTGQDLSTKSVADLITMTPEVMASPALGDVWQAAFNLGLINEDLVHHWIFFQALTEGERE
jgi:hypothetical protein